MSLLRVHCVDRDDRAGQAGERFQQLPHGGDLVRLLVHGDLAEDRADGDTRPGPSYDAGTVELPALLFTPKVLSSRDGQNLGQAPSSRVRELFSFELPA